MATHALIEDIEAVEIDENGTAVAAMIDFVAGDQIMIERQAEPGIFGWEGPTVSWTESIGQATGVETVFTAYRGEWAGERVGPFRYVTFNLPTIVD